MCADAIHFHALMSDTGRSEPLPDDVADMHQQIHDCDHGNLQSDIDCMTAEGVVLVVCFC